MGVETNPQAEDGPAPAPIVMKTARAPSNIAVIKYWGKRDEKLILPINSSISVTLDPEHLSATTTVAASSSFPSDRLWLNGKEVSVDGERYKNCLREIRARASDVLDESTGRVITKQDWQNLHVHIASVNNFPTAAGLASSAAGFACLVYALAQLMGVKEAYTGELSAIARRGSGSACRSLYGGFVKWEMGQVSSREKETSSTSGMQGSVLTSPLLKFRAENVVPKRILQMEEAIKTHDFETFAALTCADSNQFHATCLDTSPPIFYLNETSRRIISVVERWNKVAGSPQVAYTFDAGPNAVLFARNTEVAGRFLQHLLYQFPPGPDGDLSRYVIGDQTLVQRAGISSLEDLHKLPPSPEMVGSTNLPRIPGELGYLISTRPGKGAGLLHAVSLLNANTGLPL